MTKQTKLITIQIALVAFSLTATPTLEAAASNDIQSIQEIFDPLGNPTSSLNSPSSILDTLQQAEQDDKKSKFLEVLNLINENKIDKAKAKLTELTKQFPNETRYFNLQALVSTIENDLPGAQQLYAKVLQLSPNDLIAHLGLAKLALSEKHFDKAKDYANQSIAINNKSIHAYLILADVAYQQKNIDQIESILRTGYEKVNGDAASEIELAAALSKFYTAQKQPDKTLKITQELSSRYPQNMQALSLLAGAQAINNDKASAEQTLYKIINENKQDIVHRLALAQLISEQPAKQADMLKLLDDTLKIAPEQPQAEILKASYLIKIKRYDEALALTKKIQAQLPKSSVGKQLEADVYLANKQLDKALAANKEAYKIQQNSKTLTVIAEIMAAQNQLKAAIDLLNNELQKVDDKNAIQFLLATLYQRENDIPKAIKNYEEVLLKQPDNAIILNNLALLYADQQKPQAIDLGKKAYDAYPKSPAIVDTYGTVLIKLGQAKEGLAILRTAAELAPKNDEIQFHLAEAFVANADKKSALEILEKILKLEPASTQKNAASTLLNQIKSK
ncbi:MAG: tetratricopeptide repeat protein [Methylococcaceae bacterium]|jgi:putative PEP-CTERM system TPR-repeat lipoprotein